MRSFEHHYEKPLLSQQEPTGQEDAPAGKPEKDEGLEALEEALVDLVAWAEQLFLELCKYFEIEPNSLESPQRLLEQYQGGAPIIHPGKGKTYSLVPNERSDNFLCFMAVKIALTSLCQACDDISNARDDNEVRLENITIELRGFDITNVTSDIIEGLTGELRFLYESLVEND